MAILQEGLARRGWEGLLVHGSVHQWEASLDSQVASRGIRMRKLAQLSPGFRPWRDILAFAATCRLVFSWRPDIIHTHTTTAGLIGRVAALVFNVTRRRSRRCGVIHTFHGHVLYGYFGAAGSWCVRMIERVLSRLADRIVVLSERQRRELVEEYRVVPRDRAVIIPLGLELDRYVALPPPGPDARARIGLPRDAIVISFIGRLVRIKQPVLAIDAFERIAAKHPEAVLLVVGDGALRADVESEVRRHGLETRVVLTGWRQDLPDILEATDIVLLTSKNEGTPLAVIEGMAAGRAVVATAVGGVPDLIRNGETGLLVPDGDPERIAAALDRLIMSPALRARLGAAAREYATSRHSAERLVADVESLYQQVLATRARAAATGVIETAQPERAPVHPLPES